MRPHLASILLLSTPGLLHANWPPTHTAAPMVAHPADADYDKRKAEAGNDVHKLWKLYEWCVQTKRDKEGKATLRQIVKLDPTHKEANVALGHVFFDGQWFPTAKKLDEYKKEKEVAEKKAQGLVLWKDQWVPASDVPFLDRGLVRDVNGNWATPAEAKKLEEGWIRQDLEWIPPAEKENVEKGLWKCGGKWLTAEEADACHADIDRWWRIPFERFHLYTTCDRDVAVQKVKRELENAYDELVRAYGGEPAGPIGVLVLRDADQYSNFSNGDDSAQRGGTDALGLSSVHHAYFADASHQATNEERVLGLGVGYWDASSDTGNRWGVHSVRHALGLSFGEALDPSTKTYEKNKKSPLRNDAYWQAFYDEKRVPRWFRYGAAAYAERYYRDNSVGVGGDPLWARKWSIGNIHARGGLRQLKQILDFNLTVEGAQDSEKLINEAGLVMAYVLDGGNAAIEPKLKKLQEAITAGKDKKAVTDAAKALEAEILKSESDLKKFAGL
ncbi:MAG: hypothetical protein JNK02_16565 [Planctomycetes bacterium]|nr:hypothetical protein [Planctomycetota bacterium]